MTEEEYVTIRLPQAEWEQILYQSSMYAKNLAKRREYARKRKQESGEQPKSRVKTVESPTYEIVTEKINDLSISE